MKIKQEEWRSTMISTYRLERQANKGSNSLGIRPMRGSGNKRVVKKLLHEEPSYTVKRPILKSSLLRQMTPLEYINTLFKKSIPKKPS
jgi:hypothetical protein